MVEMNGLCFLLVFVIQIASFFSRVDARPLGLSKSKTLNLGKSKALALAKSKPLKLAQTANKLLSGLGTGTYYDVAAGVGSCGEMNSNDDMVVAMNIKQMKNDGNPNKNPLCDKKIKIKGKTGKYITARIVDTCPGCDDGCLDMSSALFKKVCGRLDLGVCKISWNFE